MMRKSCRILLLVHLVPCNHGAHCISILARAVKTARWQGVYGPPLWHEGATSVRGAC